MLFASLDFSQQSLVFIPLALVLGLVVFIQSRKIKALSQMWDGLTENIEGKNLERLIEEMLQSNETQQTRFTQLSERLETVETKLLSSKRYVGLVRFDAFEEVGGQQSFALAVYDEEGNGAVITSQVGRNDCRVFGKQLIGGKSDTSLTVEEENAIKSAVNLKTKARIAP